MLPLRKILSNKRSGKSGGLSSAEVTSASDDYGTPETVQVHKPYTRPVDIHKRLSRRTSTETPHLGHLLSCASSACRVLGEFPVYERECCFEQGVGGLFAGKKA